MSTDPTTEAQANITAELKQTAVVMKDASETLAASAAHASKLLSEQPLLAPTPEVITSATVSTEAPKTPRKRAKVSKRAAKKPKTVAKAPKKTKGVKASKGPSSGQSGPHIDALPWEKLNKKERLLLGCFNLDGSRETHTIESLAAEAFKGKAKNKAQANSWVRNALRRLMRSGRWLEKLEAGVYRLTPEARKNLPSSN